MVLTIIVFVHEMGHYLVARWNGIAIQTFSIGFGRELIGFDDKRGTRWKISAIPLGGYVRFVGDMNAASMPDEAFIERAGPELSRQLFVNKNVWQRIAVVIAGPVANIIFTLLVLYALLLSNGRTTIPAVLDTVPVESIAGQAGLAGGDRILSVDGYEVRGFEDFQRLIATAPERRVSITFERAGHTKTVTAVPLAVSVKDRFGNNHRIGRLGVTKDVDQAEVVQYRPNPVEAIGMTFEEVRFTIDRTVAFLGDFFVGRGDLEQLGGPVKVAKVSGEMASLGPIALIYLAAALSLNIGIFNLLPIPVLDGGHLLYYVAEAIRGRPLPQRVQDIGNRFGMALVFTLMVFATFNDTILSYIRSLG
ncbi:RIP metalloprotease RseP [Devosia sp. Root105]|uniref:RIP metalloprotease RseP n=1 Tax=Devosia sp. Root105 TaxID=1736423 RepID=UPI0020BD6825|nr:RIP metalloprotease RseP [Devosia sp. Root105]